MKGKILLLVLLVVILTMTSCSLDSQSGGDVITGKTVVDIKLVVKEVNTREEIIDIFQVEIFPPEQMRLDGFFVYDTNGKTKAILAKNKVDFKAIEDQYAIDFKTHFKPELQTFQPMLDDGLVSINDQHLVVSDMGRFLIRNICMVFDQYLNNKGSIGKFSKLI